MNQWNGVRAIAYTVQTSIFAALSAVCLVAPLATSQTASAADKADAQALRTRFVIGLPQKSDFEVFSLTDPNRVIVELSTAQLRLPPQPKNGPVGLVSSFKGGLAGNNKARVVINVTSAVVVENSTIETSKDGKSYRLALEIVPLTQTQIAARAAVANKTFDKPFALGASGLKQPPLPRPAISPKEAAKRQFKPIIVIDPGHGGHDSGAKKNGVVEKEVVLAFGKVLRDKLKKTDRYKVLMTRDDDTFVTLDGRRAFAEKNNAHLFIAVHADYARAKARGATVYSLRKSVAKSLKKSAKKRLKKGILSKDEIKTVKLAAGNVSAVTDILSDLAGRDIDGTRDRTNLVSRSLIEYMGGSTGMRSNPHKTAAFRVLKTAQFPSILVELAYVTNKQDAKLLTSDKWRDKVASSMLTAVDDYFESQAARPF